MSKAMHLVTFAIGAAVGSVTAWYICKKKYEQIAQAEIDSVKEVFSKKSTITPIAEVKVDSDEVAEKVIEKVAKAKDNADIMHFASKLNEMGYTNYSNMEFSMPGVDAEKAMKHTERPYIISPDEFDEMDDYEAISLTYYADGVLADDMDELVEDVDDVVGNDFANHFGEYEEDSVFVRNDRLKADYEILRDERNYSDVRNSKPYL